MAKEADESQSSTEGNDSYTLARRMFLVIDSLRYGMWWGIALWAITGIAVVLYLIGALDHGGLLTDAILVAALVIWFLGPFVLRNAREVEKVLRNWKDNYLAYSHIMSFELASKEDLDLTRDVVRILMGIRPIKPGSIIRGALPYDVEYATPIEGKKGSYVFDALIYTDEGTGFIRIFNGQNKKTDLSDVKTLKEQVSDVIKKHDMDILEIVAVSRVGFTEEAVKYASSEENRVGPNHDSVNLIHATPEGYAITWMQYARVSVEESEEFEESDEVE